MDAYISQTCSNYEIVEAVVSKLKQKWLVPKWPQGNPGGYLIIWENSLEMLAILFQQQNYIGTCLSYNPVLVLYYGKS